MNFVDYEKAFDSVDRKTLWKLLRHYGVPTKLVNLIKNSYDGTGCRVIHGGQFTCRFEVKTVVRQGCLLSPFLFLLAIDWIMKMTTVQRTSGIQWTLWTQLEDLDFADDLALLSHSHQQMQDKTTELAAVSLQVGLNIHKGKTKVLRMNAASTDPVTLEGNALEEVETFTYLGSVINKRGGTDADVRARIGKARVAFLQLKNIWSSRVLSSRTKIRLFNSNVKMVLLYGAETWRITNTTINKVHTFVNNCLRRILQIHWPDTISKQLIVGKDTTTTCRRGNQKKKMGLDWPLAPKTSNKHHQASADMESSRQTEKRTTKKHVATGPPGRHQEDGLHLEPVREDGPGQGTLAICCRRPMPQEGRWA